MEFLTIDRANYPSRIRDNKDIPDKLYYAGSLPDDDVPTVAIVGARMCSEYGRYLSRTLAKDLVQSGFQIINGMALGVEGISLKVAMEFGGSAYGVLGSGINICYPEENRALYLELPQNGGVISQFPFDVPPKAEHFPLRSKAVAAFADIVIIVEARKKSGTMIICDHAERYGKQIFAIPGRVTDRLSDGCNDLIRTGKATALIPTECNFATLKNTSYEFCGAR